MSVTLRTTLIGLMFMTLLLSAPSLVRVPLMLHFTDPAVRAAAPKAVERLREQGIWVVHTDLQEIQTEEYFDGIVFASTGIPVRHCFTWKHRYRGRGRIDTPRRLTTCIKE